MPTFSKPRSTIKIKRQSFNLQLAPMTVKKIRGISSPLGEHAACKTIQIRFREGEDQAVGFGGLESIHTKSV